MNIRIIIAFCFFFVLSNAFGQKFSGGFKAGYNINQFRGPALEDDNGNAVQTFKSDNGFHVGAIFNYELVKNFGLRSHILYTQRGVITNYSNDNSYLVLTSIEDGQKELAFGEKTIALSVNNSYLEIPLMIYGNYKNFELVLGASLGLMMTSSATGSIQFDGEWRRENVQIQSIIRHKYYTDKAGAFDATRVTSFTSGFETFSFPEIHTAYYELEKKDASLFSPVNFGLTGELNYYFNKGLFFGVGYYYGFTDVTRTESDVDWNSLDSSGEIITREDDDRFTTIRLSVGFRF